MTHFEYLYKTGLLIIWIIYSLLDGKRDGYLYHYRNTSIQNSGENIHWIHFLQRLLVFILIDCIHCLKYSMVNSGIFVLGMVLLFSFFHNGMYYITRKKLSKGNLYPKGWWSSSTSSEALLELNNVSRIFLAITGAIGIIASFTLTI